MLRADLGDGDDRATTGDFSTVFGGRGDDTLSGGGNLSGGPGDDVLIGDDSRNQLNGGGGRDHLRGLGGDDVFYNRSGRTHTDCGAGTDSVSTAREDVVDGDCEYANGARVVADAGAAFLTVDDLCHHSCPEDAWVATVAGRRVATGPRPTQLRLGAAAQRRLQRDGTLTVRIERRVPRAGQPTRVTNALHVRAAAR